MTRLPRVWPRLAAVATFCCVTASLVGRTAIPQDKAQEKPPEKPVVLLSSPLGIPPGETARIVLRGLRLDGATGVKSTDERVRVKLLSAGKTAVPANQSLPRVGDTQIELELSGVASDTEYLELNVTGPAGESEPYKIPVRPAKESEGQATPQGPAIGEVEPNGGFRQTQKIAAPQVVLGTIASPQDVDVYEFELSQSQTVVCELFADRLGSGLDSLLTLYSANGDVIATSDDLAESRDSRVELKQFGPGRLFLVVQDANDQGGPAHPYRLVVRTQSPQN